MEEVQLSRICLNCGKGAIKKNQNIFNYGANTFSKNSNIVPNDIFSAENLEILSSFEIC